MRIAFIKQKYVSFGGGETYLKRLMDACSQRGDEVHLIATAWDGVEECAIILHELQQRGITLGTRALKFAQEAATVVDREDFDFVVSLERTTRQDVWRAGEGVHRVWLQRRREFQPWYRTVFNEISPRHMALLKLEEECVRRTPLIIANSRMVKKDIEKVYGKENSAVKVIYNGVDPSLFNLSDREKNRRQRRAEIGVAESLPLFLFAGSGFERKGLRESLLALARMPDCRLLVLGRDHPSRWREYASQLGVSDRVAFMPPQKNIKSYLHAADVVLLPSWFDPFPNIGLESLFCGTPLLTSAFAGVHEVLHDFSGAVVDRPSDTDAMVACMEKLLQLPRTFGQAERISASVCEYTIENNRRKTLDAIHAIQFAKGR